MKFPYVKNKWGAGELSPRFIGRTDTGYVVQGSELLENFLPSAGGSLRRRPGAQYIGTTGGGSGEKARLQAMTLNHATYKFVIVEFTNLEARFIRYSTSITPNRNYAYSPVVTPYTEAELPDLKFATMLGELWIVHPSHPIAKLSFSGSAFSLSTPACTTTGGAPIFNSANNYPSTIAFFGGRMYVGGTNAQPKSIYASRTFDPATGLNRFTDFDLGTGLPTEAIYITETGMSAKPSGWLEPLLRIVAGSEDNIWMATTDMPTPESFDLVPVVESGSATIQGRAWQNMILYIGADKKTLKALTYSVDRGGFSEVDLTVQADHVLKPGIIELAVMKQTTPSAWMVRSDGKLISYHLDASAQVGGFFPHTITNGLVESIAIVKNGTWDEIYLSINKEGTRYTAWMNLNEYENTIEQCYLDSSTYMKMPRYRILGVTESVPSGGYDTFQGSSAPADGTMLKFDVDIGTFPGGADQYKLYYVVNSSFPYFQISETEGGTPAVFTDAGTAPFYFQSFTQEVWVDQFSVGEVLTAMGDGGVLPPATVTYNGSHNIVSYEVPISEAYIGYNFTSVVKLPYMDIPINGTGQGKKRAYDKVLMKFYRSVGGKVGTSLDNMEQIPTIMMAEQEYGNPPNLVTGDIEKSINGPPGYSMPLYFLQDEPMPFNLLSVVATVNIMEV